MELLFGELKQLGYSVDTTRERFLQDDTLYLRCLHTFAEDPQWELLQNGTLQKDGQEFFRCIHTIKGVSGNLGIDPIFHTTSDIVRLLRANPDESVEPQMLALLEQLKALRAILLLH